jgi:hypothetical protein
LRIPDEADQRSGVKAITLPVRSRSVLGFGRKGDRNPGTAVEKCVATLDTNSRYLASPEEMEVPAERVSMRKTHEVLRLHFDLKLKPRQFARSANLSQSTHEYLRRFTAAGLSWPLPKPMSEAELEAALFSADAKPPRAPARYLPDFSHIHKELQEHKHVTLQLLWDEYTATHPDGYRYSQFCYHYQQWKRQRDVVNLLCRCQGRTALYT